MLLRFSAASRRGERGSAPSGTTMETRCCVAACPSWDDGAYRAASWVANPARNIRTHVSCSMTGGELRYTDARRFGRMDTLRERRSKRSWHGLGARSARSEHGGIVARMRIPGGRVKACCWIRRAAGRGEYLCR